MPAFDGVRVLELGQIYNGPYCGPLVGLGEVPQRSVGRRVLWVHGRRGERGQPRPFQGHDVPVVAEHRPSTVKVSVVDRDGGTTRGDDP